MMQGRNKFKPGDLVCYMGTEFVVQHESMGLVRIHRNGQNQTVRADKVRLIKRVD